MDYKEFLNQIVKECNSKADLCRALDKKPTGGNYATIDKIIKNYNLDVSHFKNEPWNKGIKYDCKRYTLDEILIKNSPYLNTNSLKLRLINEGILKAECAVCGCKERLELHHINGDSSDNRLENLQILCINHHYDTENFRNKEGKGRTHLTPNDYILTGEDLRIREEAKLLAKRKGIRIKEAIELINNSPNKSIEDFPKKRTGVKSENISKEIECPICHKIFHQKYPKQKYCSEECVHKAQTKNKPSKEELINKLSELKCNFTQTGKYFGVTDNAVKKWCKSYDMPTQKANVIDYINNLGNDNYIQPIEIKKNRIYNKELIVKIYQEGYSQKDIASYIGCDPSTIRKYLLDSNIEIRKNRIKKIQQYDLEGNPLKIFYGSGEIYKWLRENYNIEAQELGHISDCCNGKIKSAYGYIWKYIEKIPIDEIK